MQGFQGDETKLNIDFTTKQDIAACCTTTLSTLGPEEETGKMVLV